MKIQIQQGSETKEWRWKIIDECLQNNGFTHRSTFKTAKRAKTNVAKWLADASFLILPRCYYCGRFMKDHHDWKDVLSYFEEQGLIEVIPA